jgi:polyferredoxin
MEPVKFFIQFLQSSITPVALISGVGLILLSLTNRIGRTIDRSRALISEMRQANGDRRKILEAELKILHRRNRYLKSAMAGIAFSILTSSLLIPVLLVMNLTDMDWSFLGSILLVLSITGIIISALYFFADVALSLKALDIEMKDFT